MRLPVFDTFNDTRFWIFQSWLDTFFFTLRIYICNCL